MCLFCQFEKEAGIHTFLLRRELKSYAEYRQLKSVLQRYVLIRRDDVDDCYIRSYYFTHIGYFGITAELTMKNGFTKLDIIVNPTNFLSGSYMQTDLFTQRKLCKNVSMKLDEALANIELSVNDFILSRIDLCINVFMTSPMVKAYLKLGKKSYKEFNVCKKVFEDTADNAHSLTVASRSYEVEIYDKEYEVAQRKHEPLPDGEYGKILRIETRLGRDFIESRIIKPEKLTRNLNDFLEEEEEIMERIIGYCFYPGTYMTIEKARSLIGSGQYKQQTKGIMQIILKSKTDIADTLRDIQQKYDLSDKSIQRIRRKLDMANINMVTLPMRDAKDCECDFLLGFSDIVKMKI